MSMRQRDTQKNCNCQSRHGSANKGRSVWIKLVTKVKVAKTFVFQVVGPTAWSGDLDDEKNREEQS